MEQRVRAGLLLVSVLLCPALAGATTTINYAELTQNTVWGPTAPTNPDTDYVLNSTLFVKNGYTLTIQQGTTVKVAPGVVIQVGGGTAGKLIARGTGGSPVTIEAQNGTNGGWEGIELLADATGSELDWVRIRNAKVGLKVSGAASVQVSHSTFEKCSQVGLRLENASPIVNFCTFANNDALGVEVLDGASAPDWSDNVIGPNKGYHVRAHADAVGLLSAGTTFVLNADPARFNAIRVIGGTGVTRTATWEALPDGMVYSIENGAVTVAHANVPTLTIADGSTVKFDSNSGQTGTYLVIGSSTANLEGGLVATNVLFTSSKDDSVGGDTPGDGALVPSKGEYGGLVFLDSALESSTIDGSTFRYGGATQDSYWYSSNGPLGYGAIYGCLTFDRVDLAVDGVSLESCGDFGIHVLTSGSLMFSSTTIADVRGDGVRDDGTGTFMMLDSIVSNSGGDGIHAGDVELESVEVDGNAKYGIWAVTGRITGTSVHDNAGLPVSLTAPSIAGLVDPNAGNDIAGDPIGLHSAVEVRQGTITEDAEWPALENDFVYYLPSGTVVSIQGLDTPTLAIGEGAVVKFGSNSGQSGTYIAAGSSTDTTKTGRIEATSATFTSIVDDSIAGDTMADGPVTPTKGLYGGLVFMQPAGMEDMNPSEILGCVFRFAGATQDSWYYSSNGPLSYGAVYGAITTDRAEVDVMDSEFDACGDFAVRSTTAANLYLDGIDVHDTRGDAVRDDGTGTLTVMGSSIHDNGGDGIHGGIVALSDTEVVRSAKYGVYASTGTLQAVTIQDNLGLPLSLTAPAVAAAVAASAGNTIEGDPAGLHNAIEVRAGTIATNQTWPEIDNGLVYYIPPATIVAVQGYPQPTLTIGEGAVVKFGSNSGQTGTYIAAGSTTDAKLLGRIAASGATFTSIADDSIAGDTLADGPFTPTKGMYGGLVVMAPSGVAAQSSTFTDCTFRYAGATQDSWYYSSNGPLSYGAVYGAVTSSRVDVRVEGCTIEEAGDFGVRQQDAGVATVVDTTIRRTRGDGVRDDGTGPVAVRGTTISGSGGTGVWAVDADVQDTRIEASGKYGVYATTASLAQTTIQGWGEYPVSVTAPSIAGIVDATAGNDVVANAGGVRNTYEIRGGNVAKNATWPALPAGFAYLLQAATITTVQGLPAPTLTIGEGAVVKFGPNSGQTGTYLQIGHGTDGTQGGKLLAMGATFTSSMDDSVAGDSTGDGATAPTKGQYGGIVFMDFASDASEVRDCLFRYAGATQDSWYYSSNGPIGYGAVYGAVTVDKANVLVKGTIIEQSGDNGVHVSTSGTVTLDAVEIRDGRGDGVRDEGTGPVKLRGTLVHDNGGYGLYAKAADVANTTFQRNGNYPVSVEAPSVAGIVAPASGNAFIPRASPATFNAIDVRSGVLATDAAWPALFPGFCYRLGEQVRVEVHAAAAPTLTIGPGAIVKFAQAPYYGNYIFAGSATDPVQRGGLVALASTFTSERDDTIAGDTTGDGATDPAAARWGGVMLLKYALASSVVQDCTFRYGGADQPWNYGTSPTGTTGVQGALTVQDVQPTLSGNRVTDCKTGLFVPSGSPAFDKTHIANNDVGMYVASGAPKVNNGNIEGNRTYGVQNVGSTDEVDATKNWWGSNTGPTHASNVGGTGDLITDRVKYKPFNTASADVTAPAAVSDLAVAGVGVDSVTLAWTAPGDDGDVGTAATYDLRYSTQPISSANFAAATKVLGLPAPQAAGGLEEFTVTGLIGSTTYWFAIKTSDDGPSWSAVSNVVDSAAPTPKTVTPASAQQGQKVQLAVAGGNLFPGGAAQLGGGAGAIPLTKVVVQGGVLSGLADLSAAQPGVYDLTVTNADGKAGTLAQAFTVTAKPTATMLPVGPQTVVAGDTLQFSITGPFTAATWSSTDLAVGTVDSDGLFTAVGAGDATTVYVVAANASGVELPSGQITVPFDWDRDGMRDSWEVRNGLDPHDANDAQGDPDGDGVKNLDEYRFGADPNVFNPSILADADTGGTRVYVDGNPGYAGRDAGVVPVVAVVDVESNQHTLTFRKAGSAPVTMVVTTGSTQKYVKAVMPAHATPVAYGEPMPLPELSVAGPAAPYAIDWDRDGRRDLVVGAGDGQVWFFRNSGTDADPTLDPGVSLTAGGAALGLGGAARPLFVDWDGDGDQDMLVQRASGEIAIFRPLGAGQIGFEAMTDEAGSKNVVLATGEDLVLAVPARLAAVDWNGDGKRDLLAGLPDGTLQVFLNQGEDGAPAMGAPYTVHGRSTSAAIDAGDEASPWMAFDLNGDGLQDLVAGDGAGRVRIWATDGAGAFSYTLDPTQVVDPGVTGRVVPVHADWDGDNVSDLLVGTATGEVLRLKGYASIGKPANLGASATAQAVMLSWSGNAERGLTGYNVYRAAKAEGPWTRVGAAPAGATTWVDTNVTIGTTYWYALSAFSALGESAKTDAIDATPSATLTIVPGYPLVQQGLTVVLSVTDGTAPYAWTSDDSAVATVDAATGVVTGVATGHAVVRAKDANGLEGAVVVQVYPRGALPLEVVPAGDRTVRSGKTLAFSATGGTPGYTWISLDPDAGTIDAAGTFTAGCKAGTTKVHVIDSASAVGISGTISVPADGDEDGLPDCWEVAFGLDVEKDDSADDPDEDGLTNLDESKLCLDLADEILAAGQYAAACLDPNEADTDGDGMPDGWEVENDLDPFQDDSALDVDHDKLSNLKEYQARRDPWSDDMAIDTDGDGMPDAYEILRDFDPASAVDGVGDADGDGLVNALEYVIGTSPREDNDTLTDADEDGMPDLWELHHGLSPEKADGLEDPDGDDVPNYLEYRAGTDPFARNDGYKDSDLDGLPDFWEVAFGLDPATDDAAGDPDDDGRSNLVEYRDATNPVLKDRDFDNDDLDDWWEEGFGLHAEGAPEDHAGSNPDNDKRTNLEEYMAGTNPQKLDPYPIGIDPQNPAVEAGKTQPLACVEDIDGCTWSVEPAAVATIDANGLLTAVAVGTAIVSATDGNGMTTTTVVHVYPAGGGTATLALGIAPTLANLVEGESIGFAVFGGTAPYASIVSSDEAVVALTLDEADVALAGTGRAKALAEGTADVTATDADGATVKLTVSVSKATVTLSPSTIGLVEGESAWVSASGGIGPYSFETADAGVATIDADGRVKGVAEGSTTLTAKDSNGRAGTAKVVVSAATTTVKPVELQIAPTSLEIMKGQTVTMVAVGGTAPYTWSVADPKIAEITANGVLKTLAVGSTTVTVTDAAGNTADASLKVGARPAAGGGCNAGGASPAGFLAGLSLLIGTLAVRRRKA